MENSNPSTMVNARLPEPLAGQPTEAATILPRSAWASELTRLRITLRVKQRLDQQDTVYTHPKTAPNTNAPNTHRDFPVAPMPLIEPMDIDRPVANRQVEFRLRSTLKNKVCY